MNSRTSKNIKAVGKAEELVVVIKRNMDSKDTTLVSEDTMMIPDKGGLLEEKNVNENDAGVTVKKKKDKEKEKEQQQDDSDIKVVFVKQPLGNPSHTSEEGEVTEVDPWKYVHFLEAGVSYGSN